MTLCIIRPSEYITWHVLREGKTHSLWFWAEVSAQVLVVVLHHWKVFDSESKSSGLQPADDQQDHCSGVRHQKIWLSRWRTWWTVVMCWKSRDDELAVSMCWPAKCRMFATPHPRGHSQIFLSTKLSLQPKVESVMWKLGLRQHCYDNTELARKAYGLNAKAVSG